MDNNDITIRLTELSELMENGRPLNDSDFTDIDEAISEIERLRKERDEARRELCKEIWLRRGKRDTDPGDIAREHGWDCFKPEPNPNPLDRIAELDQEMGLL